MHRLLALLCLLISLPLPAAELSPAPADYGVLIIARDRLQVATACDIGVYLQDQLVSRLYQGDSAAYTLPPGVVNVRLGIMGSTGCQPAFQQIRSTAVQVRAGAIHKYRIALAPSGLTLLETTN